MNLRNPELKAAAFHFDTPTKKIWVLQWDCRFGKYYKVGCVCDDYSGMHYHATGEIKEKPWIVLEPDMKKIAIDYITHKY